jgi:ribonuclease HI
MKIFNVQIYGDSQLVVRQITGEYKCGKCHISTISDNSTTTAATIH